MTTQAQFISMLRETGLATTNLFLIDFNRPQSWMQKDLLGLDEYMYDHSDMNRIAFFCEEANLPSVNILTSDDRIQSFLMKTPYQKEWGDLTLTFKCDSNMSQKKFFDHWLNMIVKTVSGDIGYKKNYQTDIKVSMFTKSNSTENKPTIDPDTGALLPPLLNAVELKPMYELTLTKAFPTQISDVQLSHTSTDLAKIQVTFSFNKVEIGAIDGSSYTIPSGTDGERTIADNGTIIDTRDVYQILADNGSVVVGDYDKATATPKFNIPTSRFPNNSKYSIPGLPSPAVIAEAILRQQGKDIPILREVANRGFGKF